MTESGETKTEFTSSFLLTDEQILAKGVKPAAIENYRRAYYQNAYAVSTWAPQLGSRTFRTVEIPLSVDDARSICAVGYNRGTSHNEEVLKDLHKRIGDALAANFPNGAFLKLDTRSPKDVPIDELSPIDEEIKEGDSDRVKYSKEITKMVRQNLEAIPKDQRTPNAVLEAYGKANAQFLCVRDADKALFLLTHSSRVRQDLGKQLEFPDELFKSAVMLREWDDRVPDCQGGEYRGFVYSKKLNAVTQYATCIYFPEVVQHKDEIAKHIREYFDEVVQLLPHENYIIDFILFKDGEIKVIELNPFHIGAGPGLFTWRENRELFMNGPFELRVYNEIPTEENLNSIILPSWIRFINPFRGIPSPASKEEASKGDSKDSGCVLQ